MDNQFLPKDDLINGVKFKLLVSHGDDRGFFREIIRQTDSFFDDDGFSQWSHSKMQKGVVKAWHYHHIQTDWWYIPIGQTETVLIDDRKESSTYREKLVFKMGDPSISEDTLAVCVKIPPGVLHGCKVLSDEAHLFYITSEVYNPKDEGRYPYNSDEIDHEWGENVITVENDRQRFIPTAERKI
ncbi:UNVERIFIED_CONTAM: hypothetical protein GTU68_063529 [Idotea baltica]|nr:hypothetical protein [Idotea baltica]